MAKKISVDRKEFDFLVSNLEKASSQAYNALAQLKDSITTMIILHDKLEELDPESSQNFSDEDILKKIRNRRKKRK